jgi:hypothetical protein
MYTKMLDEEVGIFSGHGTENGREKVVELARDLNCKSIINQGGALEGRNSLKVVKLIRKELAKAGINRQLLFVDPKTRQQMYWDPESPMPKLFDPDKLRPNFLAYFGPPDTRGTDFPIELGYSGFIGGKTMDEEQRQQAILRLRKFGRGQTIKCFLHQSIQHSFNIKFGRKKDHPVTLAEHMNDVKRRSLEKKSQSNWKGAVHKAQSISMQQVKTAWFKPWIDDVDSYWKVNLNDKTQKKNDLERILTGITTDIALFEVFEKSFISKRELDFRQDFEPVEHIAATQELQNHYDLNHKKAVELAKAFEKVSSGLRTLELLNYGTQVFDVKTIFMEYIKDALPKLSKEQVKDLIKTIAPDQLNQAAPMLDMLWMMNPDPIARATLILQQAGPMLNTITEEQCVHILQQEKVFEKEGMLDAETAKRLGEIQQRLSQLPKKIEEAKNEFLEQEKISKLHSKNLKKLVPKAHDVDSNSQEQVQQQQQQQQMEQQLASKKKKGIEEIKVKHVWVDWISGKGLAQGSVDSTLINLNVAANTLSAKGTDFGFDKNIKMSINQLKLLQKRKLLEGDTTDRIAIIQPSDGKSIQFLAIDQQDQNRGFSPGITAINANESTVKIKAEVHSIRSDLSDKKFGPTDYLEGVGISLEKENPKVFYRGLVQMKLIMGSIHYSQPEHEALNSWFKGLEKSQIENLTKLVCKLHDVDRVSQIRGWEKSALNVYLV